MLHAFGILVQRAVPACRAKLLSVTLDDMAHCDMEEHSIHQLDSINKKKAFHNFQQDWLFKIWHIF